MDPVVFITVHNYVIRMMCSDLFVDLGEKRSKKIYSTTCSIFSPHFSTATVHLPSIKEEFYPREQFPLSPVKKSKNLSPFCMAPATPWCKDCIVLENKHCLVGSRGTDPPAPWEEEGCSVFHLAGPLP